MSDATAGQVAGDQDPREREETEGENEAVDAQESVEAAEIDAVRAQSEEYKNQYLRAVAELDNQRKRGAREVELARQFGIERFARELLTAIDSLEMGLQAGAEISPEAVLKGYEATLRQLLAAMEKFGVVTVDPHGEPFDPQEHEAITLQPAADAEPNSVLEVVQKGYSLNGRLLRPARVVVAAEPAVPGDEDSDSEQT